ncbi:hypothetical protein SAMN04488021_12257 [Paracoccus aminovorans]|uniref:Uncharacterized protein n=2 Tax=Paracoccus aminovorans TaxID=34004 RepID=A0A1I3BK60_9RHOB|nr:hypothetical protein [Paracoccus aminovorans]CQR87059.1 hypothetical protein JCM7685_2514 [Paracoccus aminovorans]SFH62675.1 hypothetical protein SAMN04488021_12257 [Paracoccus aminovorans]
MPYPDSSRPLLRGRPGTPDPLGRAGSAGADGMLSGSEALRQITVAATPGFYDHGAALLVMCRTLEERPRELRAALSGECAALWRATTGREILDLLAQRRALGQEVFQDMPLFTLRLQGSERERELTSQLGRRYRVRVFEVARWSVIGGAVPPERLWH